ncbi:MAG: SGNH/GDSL hydrolase family protein [Kiritimatiellae bacterium]|nr:SGNH/GDSL hydrolase family protein [Kiritimatiellia bacterium]
MKKLLLKLLLIPLLTLVLCEMALRLYHHVAPSFIFYDAGYNRYRARPHSLHHGYEFNSLGFPGDEITPKQPETFRILGMGDSFAVGVVPYPDNYYTLLGEHLAKAGEKTEVINIGISAIGVKDYLALFINEGLSFEPDMVILSFFVGNDFQDRIEEEADRPLYTHSYVLTLLRFFYRAFNKTDSPGILYDHTEYCDDCPTFDEPTYLNIELDRSYICLKDNAKLLNELKEITGYLQTFSALCKDRSIEFLVVLIPDELQINTDLQKKVKAEYYPDLPPDQWVNDQPNHLLRATLGPLGIACLDLYPAFLNAGKTQTLYRLRDSHWNRAGNRLAAESIAQFLNEKRTAPPKSAPPE